MHVPLAAVGVIVTVHKRHHQMLAVPGWTIAASLVCSCIAMQQLHSSEQLNPVLGAATADSAAVYGHRASLQVRACQI
jgi:hypothetical protein